MRQFQVIIVKSFVPGLKPLISTAEIASGNYFINFIQYHYEG